MDRSLRARYVSNISIIFDCSMLLYYPFWMFMGFTLHFYIIFGTNLLTGGRTRIAIFLPILVFRRKGISNGVQMKWNLWERSFWNKHNPADLEWTSSSKRGRHEGARHAPHPHGPLVAEPTYFFLLYISTYPENIQEHHEKLFPPPQPSVRHPILEPLPALRRRDNRPRRASTSSPRPLRWVVSSLPQTFGSIVIS